MTVMRGGSERPRITILTARPEIVESLARWLQQVGYPLTHLHFESVADIQTRIPYSDVVLVHTERSKSDLWPVVEVLHHLHEHRRPVVISLTSCGALGDLDIIKGVDDFVCAPYDPHEIDLRIKFALWHRHGVQLDDMIVWGDLMINLGNYEVSIRGESIDLTLKEYELLKYLAMHRSRVFTRDDLLTAVWGYNYFGGPRTVDVHVRRLRMKIERHGVKIITTVRGVGYKFGE